MKGSVGEIEKEMRAFDKRVTVHWSQMLTIESISVEWLTDIFPVQVSFYIFNFNVNFKIGCTARNMVFKL